MIQRYMLVVCISSFAVCADVTHMALSAEPGREDQAEAGRLRYIPDPKPVRAPILIGAHLKIDNKPLLFIYRPEFLIQDMGGVENVTRAFSEVAESQPYDDWPL